MSYIKFYPKQFCYNHFWSKKEGSLIDEEVFVKTYLKHYFTYSDLIKLYCLVGEERLLSYAKDLNIEKRVRHLIELFKTSSSSP